MLEHMRIGTMVLFGYIVALALMATIAGFVYVTVPKLVSDARWVQHTEEAILLAERLQASMVDQETGERGFLVTGDDEFLEPYESGKRVFAETLATARAHMADNPAQLRRLDRIEQLGRQFDERAAAPEIAKRRAVNERRATFEELAATFGTKTGKASMDELRRTVAELQGEEQRLLAERVAASSEAARRATRGTLVVLLVAVATMIALAFLIARSIRTTGAALLAESAKLTQAAQQGRLHVRGATELVSPEFRPVVAGMNATMEAFAKPVGVTVDYLTRISRGDLPPRITDAYEGDFDRIKEALNRCIDAVGRLVGDATMLSEAAVAGRLETRADAAKHEGDFAKVVRGVNATLDTVVDQSLWYEAILDAVPFPVHVTDANMKWTFMNKPFEQLLVKEGRIRDRKQAMGLACSNAGANICDTDKCGIVQLGRGNGESYFDWCGMSCKQDTSNLVDRKGRKIGYVEIVQDLTGIIRQRDYSAREVERVSRNLGRLAVGDVDCDLSIAPADAHTREAHANFSKINGNLAAVKDAIGALVADATTLSAAAVAGELRTRADAARHQGDFRKVVEGVNATLDAVIAPVNEAAAVLEQLAQRDLRARVTGSYRGDNARIQRAVNSTAEALHAALAQVADAVEQVSSASSQIASSSQAVAGGASEQASALEETSASIESVGSMTKAAADHAQQANHLAQGARTAATEGAAAVDQMQGAMTSIKASAEGTSQIIKDINDIAFQTNLLALNAAVEAARAGEAGRGFAVVAEEVRSLALRAKEAATKTEELIRQSVRQAGEGEVSARHVTVKLGEIVSGIGKVSDIVSEIAAAATEQRTGIDQVARAVTEMDKVTQQNAASAEESSSAASELSAQAEELAAMVASFRLDRAAAAPSRAPRPAARPLAAPAARPAAAAPAFAPSRAAPQRSRATAKAEAAFPMGDDGESLDF